MKRFMRWINTNDWRIGTYVVVCIVLLVCGVSLVGSSDDSEWRLFGLFMLFSPGLAGLTTIVLYDPNPPKSQ